MISNQYAVFGDNVATEVLVAVARIEVPVVDPVGAHAAEVPAVSGNARFPWPPGSGAQTATKYPGVSAGALQVRFTVYSPEESDGTVAARPTTLSGVMSEPVDPDPKMSVCVPVPVAA